MHDQLDIVTNLNLCQEQTNDANMCINLLDLWWNILNDAHFLTPSIISIFIACYYVRETVCESAEIYDTLGFLSHLGQITSLL